ncbi:MAG: ubiquinol-cytochrome c reductase iron-sulfur subunit [Gemmatimonadetes bacterium]|nr:ubiquinol-cytochrome c reductase iron-sulfur subunit [Gemmatimonadota bacterium]
MDRRGFANLSLKTGIVAAIAAAIPGIATLRGRAKTAGSKSPEPGDRLVFALGQNAGQPVTEGSFTQNEAVLAFPEGKSDNHDNLVLVCRLNPALLAAPTSLDGVVRGVVAYSAICTHLGCTVRFSEEPMDMAPFPHIHCPCHAALFDPHRGAVVLGGPAPRPLPQLPVRLNERGEVVADGNFAAPVGVVT